MAGTRASSTARWRVAVTVSVIASALCLAPSTILANPAIGSAQECSRAGLAKPRVFHRLAMHRAGIRPGTPHHYFSQATWGWFRVDPLPEGCGSSVVRAIAGRVQMQKRTDRKVWVNIGPNGNLNTGSPEFFKLQAGPIHAWPDYLFNECVGGKGWLRVRGVLYVKIKDPDTRSVVAERRYTYRAKVYGSCKLARTSKRQTAHYKEEWGKGSGSQRASATRVRTARVSWKLPRRVTQRRL